MHKKVQGKKYNIIIFCIFLLLVIIVTAFSITAARAETAFGKIEVTEVNFTNFNKKNINAKLYKPLAIRKGSTRPGVLFLHGYASSRDKGAPLAIELARSGLIVLCIDLLGSDNSDIMMDYEDTEFDPTLGARTSLAYLRSLPCVREDFCGIAGHSLGGNIAYDIALKDNDLKAIVLIGNAYKTNADYSNPANMMMIFARWDDFRKRMTGTENFMQEWMSGPATRNAIAAANPVFGKTYGKFDKGTARKVFVPCNIHTTEPYGSQTIAETVNWFQKALMPGKKKISLPAKQIWPYKELSTLLAMLCAFASLIPLAWLLLQTKFFHPLLKQKPNETIISRREFRQAAITNGILLYLYIPIVFIMFAFHVYVVRIDKIFPMMTANAVIWWFLVAGAAGFLFLKRWLKKHFKNINTGFYKLGISFSAERFSLNYAKTGRGIILALVLFLYIFTLQFILEEKLHVNFHFIFAFANNLTTYRVKMFFLYFPLILTALLLNGFFLHGQMAVSEKKGSVKNYFSSLKTALALMLIPVFILLCSQYLPFLLFDVIPYTGPGGMFAFLIFNLFHLIGVLLLIIPLSTWFKQITGSPYTGAFLNALLVSWMFASTQVITPLPI
ncbi:MAG TPA: alpha/beta fold hydrolase [Spirochaetota bacterium]|nr:alpha/beta fold hydrolase [Spirochaetota bacterium]